MNQPLAGSAGSGVAVVTGAVVSLLGWVTVKKSNLAGLAAVWLAPRANSPTLPVPTAVLVTASAMVVQVVPSAE